MYGTKPNPALSSASQLVRELYREQSVSATDTEIKRELLVVTSYRETLPTYTWLTPVSTQARLYSMRVTKVVQNQCRNLAEIV